MASVIHGRISFIVYSADSPVKTLKQGLDQLNGVRVSNEAGDFAFRVGQKKHSLWDTRISLVRLSDGQEVGCVDFIGEERESRLIDSGWVTIIESERRKGLATLILMAQAVAIGSRQIVTGVSHKETVALLEENKLFKHTPLYRLLLRAGLKVVRFGYFDRNGEYRREPFGDFIKEDRRVEGREGIAGNEIVGHIRLILKPRSGALFPLKEAVKQGRSSSALLTGEELADTADFVSGLGARKRLSHAISLKLDQLLDSACRIFAAYSKNGYLNQQGESVKDEFEVLGRSVDGQEARWGGMHKELVRLAGFIPTVRNPNTGLFVEVFEGFSDRQMKTLALAALGTLEIYLPVQITTGCSNQCLTCYVKKRKGALKHMPFPLIVKVVDRIIPFLEGGRIELFFNSEPLDYSDPAIGASIVDVARILSRHKEINIGVVTHGLGGARSEGLEELVSRFPVPFEISFHLYRERVLSCASELASSGGSLTGAIEKIKHLETARFTALVKGAIRSGQEFSVRFYRPDARIENLLQGTKAAKILRYIQLMQVEVWEDVKRQVEEDMGQGVLRRAEDSGLMQIKDGLNVIWFGDAAKLLRKLGVKDEVIRQMQRLTPTQELSTRDYTLAVGPEGGLTAYLAEGRPNRFRTAGELYGKTIEEVVASNNIERFRRFLRFLGIVLKMDHGETTFRIPAESLNQEERQLIAEGLIDDGISAEDRRFTEGTLECSYFSNYVRESGTATHKVNFYRILFDLFISGDEIAPLLADLSDENVRELHAMLVNVPFPVMMDVRLRTSPRTHIMFDYDVFINRDNSLLHRDIFTTFRDFSVPARAFAPRASSSVLAPAQDKRTWHYSALVEDRQNEFCRNFFRALLAKYIIPGSILEVGSGGGTLWTMAPAAIRKRLVQSEPDLNAIAYAVAHGYGKHFSQTSVYDLSRVGAFNNIIEVEVLKYLQHPELAVRQISQVAKPGARFISVHSYRGCLNDSGWLFRVIPALVDSQLIGEAKVVREEVGDELVYRALDQELKRLQEQGDFHMLEQRYKLSAVALKIWLARYGFEVIADTVATTNQIPAYIVVQKQSSSSPYTSEFIQLMDQVIAGLPGRHVSLYYN
ncbi:methyltransferase domain-containing protein, partial [Candidatus Omnitrophota bacterium]